MMMNITPDVNFWLDAARNHDSALDALSNPNRRMAAIMTVIHMGTRAGVRFHTGPHVLNNIRKALASPEVSYDGTTTREAWASDDIGRFVSLVKRSVIATGGDLDVPTVAHHVAIEMAVRTGAPDGEDQQMLTLAVESGATIFATSDGKLLEMQTYRDLEIWTSADVDAEIAAVRRNAVRQKEAVLQKT